MIETTGKIIARVRKERGLTQAGLAYSSDLSVAAISLIEQGVRQPSLPALFRIAEALAVNPGDLLPKTLNGQPPITGSHGELTTEEFAAVLEDLELGTLNDLGRTLAAEHRRAVEFGDWGRAGDLYVRRTLVWGAIKELDPPLCQIKFYPDREPEVTFYREPSEGELEDLKERLGQFTANRELVPA